MTQKSANPLTPDELLKQSIVKIKDIDMDLVPYSIALQALTMEKANKVMGEVTDQLSQLSNIESELTSLLKQYEKKK
tara:strand:- start:2824 stop:3054 length:231 start_codon:yes stop_codon:yes gene_type:complete